MEARRPLGLTNRPPLEDDAVELNIRLLDDFAGSIAELTPTKCVRKRYDII